MHYAVTTSYPKAIKPTLQRVEGVMMPMDITDNEGKTPLHLAAERGDSVMIEHLLTLGATPTLQDLLGNTCLHQATSSCDDPSVITIVQREDLHPCFCNIQNGEMQTALHLAAMHENADTLNILLRCGCDGDIRDVNGRSPLHVAVLHGNLEAVDRLFTPPYPGRQSSEAHVDNYGDSPLGLACFERCTNIAKFLIENGANVNHLNGEKENILMLLLKRNAYGSQRESVLEIYETLTTTGDFNNVNGRSLNLNSAMSLAILNGHTEIAEKLVDSMPRDASFHGGNRPLHLAIQKRMLSIIDLILPHANINAQNDERETPLHTLLHCQALYENLHSLPLLRRVTNSRSLTLTDKQKRTPLLLAVEKGLDDVAKWLIAQGSSVTAQNLQGNTILHLLATDGNTNLLNYLFADDRIKNKLDVYKKNCNHLTAGEVAKLKNNMECCRHLSLRPKPTTAAHRYTSNFQASPSGYAASSRNETCHNTSESKLFKHHTM